MPFFRILPVNNPVYLVTTDALLKICYKKKIGAHRITIIARLLNSICPMYGISSADIIHEFLANVLHESTEFSRYEESMNYSAEGLLKTFGRHRISEAEAYRYGRTKEQSANQKAIGNILYGGTWGKTNLGNEQPDDGFNFRGSGPIQITGRRNFTQFANFMRNEHNIQKTLEQWAEALRTSDEWGIHSACWLFVIAKNLISLAIADEFKMIVKRINGGYIGMEEREKYYELCKKWIPS